MAKSKYSTALYEVISNRGEEGKPAASKPPLWRPKPQAEPETQKPKVTRREVRNAGSGDDGGERPPMVDFRSGRVELSLNSVSAAVVVGVVLLGLFTSYQLGALLSGGGEPPVAKEVQEDDDAGGELANLPNDPGVLARGANTPRPLMGSNAEAPRTPDRTPSPEPEQPIASGSETPEPQYQGRQAGLNYVILARFKAEDKADALHAAGWLAEKQGIGTVLEKHGDLWWLISTEGFDYSIPSDKRRCEEFCSILARLSTAYKEEFKGKRVIRYSFHDPEVRNAARF